MISFVDETEPLPRVAGSSDRRWHSRRRYQRSLALLLGMLFLATVLLAAGFFIYQRSVSWVEHTQTVRLVLEKVYAALLDAETGQRGYILTRDKNYLALYRSGVAETAKQIGAVESLVSDNPGQQVRLESLRPLVEQRLQLLERGIRIRDSQGLDAAIAKIQEGRGFLAMEKVRELVRRMEREETKLLTQRKRDAQILSVLFAVVIFVAGLGLASVLLAGFRRVEQDYAAEREEGEALALALSQSEDLVSQRDLLLREVNHRVKNSLQLASSLLSLQAARIADPQSRQYLTEMRSRINAIAAVHQRLYTSDRYDQVAIGEFLGDLCAQLEQASASSGGKVEFEGIGEDQLPITQAVPLALIVNELVTNALKHAFSPAQSGTVSVRLEHGADHALTLDVIDEGQGLPDGFDPRAGGLGMQIVTGLAAQIGGVFEVESRPTGGTRFRVRAPAGGTM